MPLAADLGTRLDAGALVSAVLAALQGHAVDLQAVSVPADGGRLGDITASSAVDLSSVGAAVQSVTSQLAPQLLALAPRLPGLDALIAAITLVEQVSTGDLVAELDQLAASFGQTLEGSREGGLVAVLMRVSQLLSTAPAASRIGGLLQSLLGAVADASRAHAPDRTAARCRCRPARGGWADGAGVAVVRVAAPDHADGRADRRAHREA
jgi:hypothetical protein